MLPSLRLRALGGLSVLLAACGDPRIVTIARDRDAGEDSPARKQRGRVEVIDGTLVSDRGTPLRGMSIEADLGLDFELYAAAEQARPVIRTFFERLTGELGLNTFELNLEGWDVVAGSRAELGDVFVEESSRAGAYLLFGPGSGPIRDGRGGSGWFDPMVVAEFWNFYAARYASQTHVVYQVQKTPERTCDTLWNDDSLTLERNIHALIRSRAPDTHIVMFSFGSTPTLEGFEENVGALTGQLEWRNASVGFHAHDECVPLSEVERFPREVEDGRRIALLVTELPPVDFEENLLALEAQQIGWMHYHWLNIDSDLSTFRLAHDQAAISWCPDFGSWPMDAETCSR